MYIIVAWTAYVYNLYQLINNTAELPRNAQIGELYCK